jgi:hypothetical protein
MKSKKKLILKFISNKVNKNKKNKDKIWQIKKIKGGWNWKKLQFYKLFQIK